MQKKLFISILSLFSIVSATDVSGNITANTTWTANGSPYNVTGDVGVPAGYTLTIGSGVTVNYLGDYKILVKGNIIINGTVQSHVIFNGNSSTGSEIMILFKSTDLSNSSINYTDYTGPQYALQLSEESEHNQDEIKNSDTLKVNYSSFNNTGVFTNGYSTTAGLIIDNSTFSSCIIKGYYPRTEPIIIKNSVIDNSTIASDSYNYGITIKNSTVKNSTITMGCCSANFDFQNSVVYNTSSTEGGGSPVNGDFKIVNSKFINSPVFLGSAKLTITNSIISDNSSDVIYLGNGPIENSSFIGVNSNNGIKISGRAGYNIGGSTSISGSLLYGFTKALVFEGVNTVTISNNNLLSISQYAVENSSSSGFSATNNFWGTTSSTAIENLIYHGNDDLDLGTVAFNPYLSLYNTDAPISPPANVTKVESGGNIILTWDANLESDVAGYKIHYGDFTGYSYTTNTDLGNVTTYTLFGVSIDSSIAITAYDGNIDGTDDQVEGYQSWFATAIIPPYSGPVWYVSTSGSEANEGSQSEPFAKIQTAIDSSSNGDTVLVAAGTYVENINYNGKNIVVGSLYLTTSDTSYISSTIIDGNESGSVVKFVGNESSSSNLIGFTIQNGLIPSWIEGGLGGGIRISDATPIISHLIIKDNTAYRGGGIYSNASATIKNIILKNNIGEHFAGGIEISSNSTLENLLIRNNSGGQGGGVHIYGGAVSLINCTITNNTGTSFGGGVFVNSSGSATIKNSIIRGNTEDDIRLELQGPASTVSVSYSNIENGEDGIVNPGDWSITWGTGNIDADPYFCNADSSDFTLAENSPCVGTGENGANMGAFGIACEAIPLNPVIVEIPDTTMNEDGNITMGLYATSQLGYSMTFTITSDTADVNPSYDGAILNLIPTPDWNGSALITVIVTDENSLSDSTEFTLTVLPVNDAPTISAINDTIILEDSWDQFINISGISSGSSNESQSFVLSATTNNSELIFLNPGHDFTYTSPDSIGTFSFSTIANAYGEATITIMVQDDGGIENGGIDTVRISFNVSVTSVNDIPIIEEIFSQYVYEDSTLTIAIYASDVEDEYLEIFAYSQGPGVETFIFGSDSLLMVPEPDWNGETLIDVYTFDSQGAGDTMSFTLNVIPVDDNPFLSGYLNDVYFYEDFGDTSIVELDSVFTDIDGELTFSFELMDSSFVQANLNDGFLQFTAIPDSSGLTMLILTASNPTRAEISDTIEVRVFAVNDAPVIDGIDSIIFEEDQSYSLMSFVQLFDQNIISDIDNTIESLNFEWSVDVESIQIEWDGNLNSNPMIIPEPDFFGMGTLTLCVFDGEYEVCSENIVTITPVNDAPFFISELSGFVGVGIGFDIPLELGDIDSDSLIITIEPDSTTPDWVNLINQTFSGTAPFQGNFFIPLQVSDGDTVIVDTFILSVENFNPEITSITDVPDDQGGRVYVAFNASFFDHLDETNQNYGIMRFDSFEDTVAWVALTSFPAIGDEQYIFEVLTLGDSTANDDGLTEFKVVASMNAGVFHSNSVWGYSVDNIAPGVPTGLIATAMEENIQVIWDLSPEDDFQYFLLEKSMTSEFTEYESISTTDTAYTDLEYEMNQPYFYRLAVADHADNVSDYSEVVEIAVLAIDGNLIPDVFALHQNYPNPFNPVTTISYDLPEVAQVVISIYDIMGREVKTLVNLEQIAGFKSVVWDATNNMGQPVSAGMYLYRISALQQNGGQAGDFYQVKKMVLLK